MKKINLKWISEILTEKEMKNVVGGSGDITQTCNSNTNSGCPGSTPCTKSSGVPGTCKYESNSFNIMQCRCS